MVHDTRVGRWGHACDSATIPSSSTIPCSCLQGTIESVDAKRGLRVRLDGFSKREWVTNEDEWEWLDGAGGAEGPKPVELIVGHSLLRDLLAR